MLKDFIIMASLLKRLENIWETPDFNTFFKNYAKKSPRKVKKGDTLFYQGDETGKVFFLKKGFVKLFQMSEDGHEPVNYLYGPESLLGLRALTAHDPSHWHTCEALTDCEVVSMSSEEYKKILADNPEYIIDLLYSYIQRLNYTERRLYGFVTAETVSRVAAFLYDCVLRFGEKNNKGTITIPIPLTHQLVSEFVGSARESVTIALNKLVRESVITHTRGSITVLNKEKLKTQAGIS